MKLRLPRAIFVSSAFAGLLISGCKRDAAPESAAGRPMPVSESDILRQRVTIAEQALAAKSAELTAAISSAGEAAKAHAAEWQAVVAEKDAEVAALKAAQTDAKKNGWAEFAEASSYGTKGPTIVARDRYQSFVRKYPENPLAADAQRAVVELTAKEAEESARRAKLIDPRRAERQLLDRYNNGTATGEELAPMLKGKSRGGVVQLLGAPDKTYRDNTEIGYDDKIIDKATGLKATLVVGFKNDRVTKLRIGYAGREITP